MIKSQSIQSRPSDLLQLQFLRSAKTSLLEDQQLLLETQAGLQSSIEEVVTRISKCDSVDQYLVTLKAKEAELRDQNTNLKQKLLQAKRQSLRSSEFHKRSITLALSHLEKTFNRSQLQACRDSALVVYLRQLLQKLAGNSESPDKRQLQADFKQAEQEVEEELRSKESQTEQKKKPKKIDSETLSKLVTRKPEGLFQIAEAGREQVQFPVRGVSGIDNIFMTMARIALAVGGWVAGLYLSFYFGVHSLYFICSCFLLMFCNLGERREGEVSAYSVFNNGQRIPGSFDDGLVSGITGKVSTQSEGKAERKREDQAEDEAVTQLRRQYLRRSSKHANQECYCGSSRKYKKCCYPRDCVDGRLKAE